MSRMDSMPTVAGCEGVGDVQDGRNVVASMPTVA